MSTRNLIVALLNKLRAVWGRVNTCALMAGTRYLPLSTLTLQDAEYLYRAEARARGLSIERLFGAGATSAQKGS